MNFNLFFNDNFYRSPFVYYCSLSIIINYQYIQVLGIRMSQDEMHSLLNEIDLTYNGQMELQDYLQVNH